MKHELLTCACDACATRRCKLSEMLDRALESLIEMDMMPEDELDELNALKEALTP